MNDVVKFFYKVNSKKYSNSDLQQEKKVQTFKIKPVLSGCWHVDMISMDNFGAEKYDMLVLMNSLCVTISMGKDQRKM